MPATFPKYSVTKHVAVGLWRAKLRNPIISLLLTFCLTFATSAGASARGLIRDTEIEALMRAYSIPIFRAAGLSAQNIKVHLVSDMRFNAFVVDGHNMFINTGTLTISKTPNQVIGVIAHEAGHIAGGHLARLRAHLKKAQSIQAMLSLLTAGAAIGGAATGNDNLSRAGQAAGVGTGSFLHRSMSAYQRNEEAAADQSAITYLNRTKQSGRGMLKTFEYFSNQMLGQLNNIDPYFLTHPLPQDRIAQLKDLAQRSPYFDRTDPPALQMRHDMARAKLTGFMRHPNSVFRRYPKSNTTIAADYARAIATYKLGGIERFLPKINSLIKRQPNNPYFYELKGQFLCEGGKPSLAIQPLKTALKKKPKAPLIKILLGQCMLQSNNPAFVKPATKLLQQALLHEPQSSTAYRQLANSYGRQGNIARAELSSAYAYLYEGRLKLAKTQAARAKKRLKRGTPLWIKADDVLNIKVKKSR